MTDYLITFFKTLGNLTGNAGRSVSLMLPGAVSSMMDPRSPLDRYRA